MFRAIALLALLLAVGSDAAPSANDLRKQAALALQRGKTDEALKLAGQAIQKEPANANLWLYRGTILDKLGKNREALADFNKTLQLDPKAVEALHQRGCTLFKLGKVKDSAADFDRYVALRPSAKKSHWQRGISLYYAGRFAEGARQFEQYQDFDSADVENAIWRFMCKARSGSVAMAQKDMLKIGNDKRVPMRQIYDLYKGTLKPADVLAAVKAGNPDREQLSRRLFYAHLYLGIWYDLNGDTKTAIEHLDRAVEHRIGHYMWDVARVHRDLLRQRPAR